MKRLLFSLLCYFWMLSGTFAQINGCTDPQSTNYNPAATVNDGSCTYSATTLTLTDKTNLSAPLLNESSGLTFINGKLWTFNDSGNANDIYRIDTSTSTVYQTVDISNATNTDWEDMTSNNDYLFIGDFGNNNGNRQNLKIYRVNKADLTTNATAVTAAVINFSYSDQTSFPSLPNNNNFDCEAMIFLNDSIHLFSKNWVDLQTKHYVLPNSPGTHVAQYRETYNTGFLVTSASVQQFGVIALIGYIKTGTQAVSMCMLYDYKNNLLFNGNKRKFNMSTQLVQGQMEGVEFFNSSRAFVTNELFTNGATVPAKLRVFNIASYLPASFLYAKPSANFAGNNQTICAGGTISFSDQSANAPTSWQWTFSGGNPASSTLQNPQVQYLTPGTYTVKLVASNGAGSESIVKTNYITVNPAASASITAGGPTSFCTGGSVTLNANTGSGLTYQWQNNFINIPGAGSSSYLASAAGNYSCVVTNNCGSVNSNTIAVDVNSIPTTPTSPTGLTLACKNTTNNVYSISLVNGATSYTWNVASGASIVSGQGTNQISVNFLTTAVSGNICVYASNGCGNSLPVCKTISIVSAVPSKPASLTGDAVQCPGNTGIQYSCSIVNSASSYNWVVPATASIVSGQGTSTIVVNFLSGFTTGDIKVAAVNCKGSSAYRSLTIRSKPSTPGVVTGPVAEVCAGTSNVVYSINPVVAASGYNWTAPANASIASGQGTNSVTVNFGPSFTTGALKVSSYNVCGASTERSTTIRSTPPTPGVISGSNTICINQSGVTYSIAPVTGSSTYNWVVPAGAVITSGQTTNSITVNFGTTAGVVKVRAGNSCGNSAYRTLSVSVNCREYNSGEVTELKADIFPNPSRSNFTLMFNGNHNDQIKFILRDLMGREVEKIENLSTQYNFEFGSTLASGVYFAEISNSKENRIMKLVKQE